MKLVVIPQFDQMVIDVLSGSRGSTCVYTRYIKNLLSKRIESLLKNLWNTWTNPLIILSQRKKTKNKQQTNKSKLLYLYGGFPLKIGIFLCNERKIVNFKEFFARSLRKCQRVFYLLDSKWMRGFWV